MAMEYLQTEFKKARDEFLKSFEGQILIGIEYEGRIKYCLFGKDIEALKYLYDKNKLPGKLVYVGIVKLDGEEPKLEEVNLSQVKYKGIELTEKGKQLLEQGKAEIRQRLEIKSSSKS
ncbi:MAG: hypothetical protein QXO95_01405 [Candidatus Aenigmatarchaeota archaeon]